MFGVPFDWPIRHLRDYLQVVRSLLDTGTAGVRGATRTADLPNVPPATHCSVAVTVTGRADIVAAQPAVLPPPSASY